MMKKCLTLLLTVAMLQGVAMKAEATDFNIKGQWWMGFTNWNAGLISKTRDGNNPKQKTNNDDKFHALQRLRIQLEAVASENVSGTVQLQIGNQRWGQAKTGGALGTDGTDQIKVRWAFMDWVVPDTDLKIRMGLQPITLPNKAGGSAVLDSRSTGVVASYKFNENAALTAMWLRPSNDNFVGDSTGANKSNFLDNMDLVALLVPLKFEGVEVTPWALLGARGKNTFNDGNNWNEGDPFFSLRPYFGSRGNTYDVGGTDKAYGNMFWAGLPLAVTAWDPLNIEFDFNYGHAESMGSYTAHKGLKRERTRGNTQREGWLAKGLVEYKIGWGVPGFFAWYASGDDGSVKNGSERMPGLVPYGNFTSFMGDGNLAWAWEDYQTSYAGTWGMGLQIRDISFVEDITHTLRAAWWGGTNSTSMIKYMDKAYSWNCGTFNFDGPYMTTNDGMLEFNLVNAYKVYADFNINLELGYIANFMDNDTWKKAGQRDSSFEKQDAWKIQLAFMYNF